MVDDEPTGRNEDRRQHPRLSAKIDIRFGAAAEAERALKAYSINLSMGGICLRTQRVYEVGEELALILTVENEEFDLRGVVAWARNGAIGVRFVNLDTKDVHRLEGLFERMKL